MLPRSLSGATRRQHQARPVASPNELRRHEENAPTQSPPASPTPRQMTGPRPFEGISVVELGHFVAVPYAGQMLAAAGAKCEMA